MSYIQNVPKSYHSGANIVNKSQLKTNKSLT